MAGGLCSWPGRARGSTVVPFTVEGSGRGVAQHIEAGGHTFQTDAYPAFGGNDEAPSPLFYALAALSSCNQVTGSLVAKDLGITLGDWTFEVVGDLDTAVLVGGEEGNANFTTVTVRASVQTDADDAQFAQLVSETERRCPVTQLYKRSGLEFDTPGPGSRCPPPSDVGPLTSRSTPETTARRRRGLRPVHADTRVGTLAPHRAGRRRRGGFRQRRCRVIPSDPCRPRCGGKVAGRRETR